MRKETPLSLQKNELMDNVFVIILCAGKGTRLGKITKFIPKPLIKIEKLNNKPLLFHIISTLNNSNFKNLVIVKGYLGKKIEKYISSLQNNPKFSELNLITVDAGEDYKKGPFYSLLSIKNIDKIFNDNKNLYLVIPGDTIFDSEFFKVIFKFILRKETSLYENTIIFYQKTTVKKIRNKEIIPTLKINPSTENILEKISLIKTSEVNNEKQINLLYPLVLIPHRSLLRIFQKSTKFSGTTIREWINYHSREENKISAYEIEREYNFFDIDTSQDLNYLERKEVDNRFH